MEKIQALCQYFSGSGLMWLSLTLLAFQIGAWIFAALGRRAVFNPVLIARVMGIHDFESTSRLLMTPTPAGTKKSGRKPRRKSVTFSSSLGVFPMRQRIQKRITIPITGPGICIFASFAVISPES